MLNSKNIGISSNALKVIGAIAMVIDHIGVFLLPEVEVLRIIGRLSFPIFSCLICEGCRHTRNKAAYFVRMFILGVVTSAIYYFVMKELYLNVLVTFSLSIAIIFALQYLKKSKDAKQGLFRLCILGVILIGVYILTELVTVDYNTFGVLLPVFPALVMGEGDENNNSLLMFKTAFPLLCIGVAMLSVAMGGLQYFSLFSLPLLALYNGKRGFKLPKYFFYVFYPAHLVVIYIIGLFTI